MNLQEIAHKQATTMKAKDVKIGDTIVFHDTCFNFVVEDITDNELGVQFHYNNGTASSVYEIDNNLSIIRPNR